MTIEMCHNTETHENYESTEEECEAAATCLDW